MQKGGFAAVLSSRKAPLMTLQLPLSRSDGCGVIVTPAIKSAPAKLTALRDDWGRAPRLPRPDLLLRERTSLHDQGPPQGHQRRH